MTERKLVFDGKTHKGFPVKILGVSSRIFTAEDKNGEIIADRVLMHVAKGEYQIGSLVQDFSGRTIVKKTKAGAGKRKGVSSLLLAIALKRATEEGGKNVRLETSVGNRGFLEHLVTKMGAKEDGKYVYWDEERLANGKWLDYLPQELGGRRRKTIQERVGEWWKKIT